MAKIKIKRERVKFASDNVAGACPEVLDAILKANEGDSTPYGNDQISTNLQNKFSEIFEKEVIVFPTASGTAANALALSTMTPSYGNDQISTNLQNKFSKIFEKEVVIFPIIPFKVTNFPPPV